MFNPVASYGYLLSDMYLFMADITNPDFLVWSCRTWIGLDITRFCEQQRQPSSGSTWPACPKNGKSGPLSWGRGGSTQFAQQFEFAVTAPPLVGCVVWSQCILLSGTIKCFIEVLTIEKRFGRTKQSTQILSQYQQNCMFRTAVILIY